MARDCSPRANATRPCRRHSDREQGLRQGLADLIGRPAEHGGGAVEIALQQVRFGQRGANDELVLPLDAARLQQRLEQLGRCRAAPALEQRGGAGQHWLQAAR